MKELIAKIKTLPPLKATLQQVLEMLGSERAGWDQISRKISQDAVLSGRILQLANSSFYGFSRKVKTVDSACALLGANTVRNLVLTLVAMSQVREGNKNSKLDYEKLWQHSLHVGCVMQAFPVSQTGDTTLAFTTGLFHALGLIVEDYFFQEVAAAEQQACATTEAYLALSTVRHRRYCAALLGHWRFPNDIVNVFEENDSESAKRLNGCMALSCGKCGVAEFHLHCRAWDETAISTACTALAIERTDFEKIADVGDKLFGELSSTLLGKV